MKKCFLFFHDWGKWIDKDHGTAEMGNAFGMKAVAKYIYQERRCVKCNSAQLRLRTTL